MNRREFIRAYAAERGISINKATDSCIGVFDFLSQTIKKEDKVYIKGLGTFKKKLRAPRIVGTFDGSGTVEIPAKEKVIFEMTEQEE